eukprot:Seg820.2 transcript_id=Seg820.2/GoldUCD/mRNA.D3Y31 product="hypothetical protein" protein_id=Seg820.2/GoldUCD/D3Y31
MLVTKNQRLLSTEQLKSFTRIEAFQCKIPKTQKPKREALNRYGVAQKTVTPCQHFAIPPTDVLLSWKHEITKLLNMARGFVYMECEFGLYKLWTCNAALQLHKAREIRHAVTQEIDWFSEACRLPSSVESTPTRVVLNNFRSKIHNHAYSAVLPEFGTTPGELSQLCCDRLLSGDHMRWIVKKLNEQQKEMYCIYVNSVLDKERAAEVYLRNHALPKKIGFLFNVGKERSNCTGESHWDIVIPKAFGHLGSHFSIAVLDIDSQEIVYGDSLGWSPPNKLYEEVSGFYKAIFKEEMPLMQVIECHKSDSSGFGHKCTNACSLDYPLQKDGNICGVVAIVMLAIASLLPGYFDEIVRRKFCANQKSLAFFKNPTMYSKYLRQVIMAWFSEERISMNYLICNGLSQECELSSDSGEPNEEIVRVNFEMKDDTNLVMNNDQMDAKVNKKVAGKGQVQNSDKADFRVENGDEVDDVCVKIEGKMNGQVKKEVGENDFVRKHYTTDGQVKMEADEANDFHAKNVGRKCMGRSSDVGKKMKSPKSFNCHHCSFITTRGFNLRRHVQRNHGDGNIQSHESGGCICLECGHKCFLIKDLREHLTRSHGFVFRIVNKEFQDLSGRLC